MSENIGMKKEDGTFTNSDVFEALEANNLKKVKYYLGCIGLDETSCPMNKETLTLISGLFHTAAEELGNKVSVKTAEELLWVLAPAVDVVDFCLYMMLYVDYDRKTSLPKPSEKIINLLKGSDAKKLRKELKKMTDDEYYGVLKFIKDDEEIRLIPRSFSVVLLEYAYQHIISLRYLLVLAMQITVTKGLILGNQMLERKVSELSLVSGLAMDLAMLKFEQCPESEYDELEEEEGE